MNTLEIIEELERRSFSTYIEFDGHKVIYMDVAEYLVHGYMDENNPENLVSSPEVLEEMVRLNRVVEIRCYPRTAICFLYIYHHDLAAAAEEMLAALNEDMPK